MELIPGAPHVRVAFDEAGRPTSANDYQAVFDVLRDNRTDVVIFAHGWNNSTSEADQLFERFYNLLGQAIAKSPAPDRRLATVGVYWPSKAFSGEDLPSAGGTASLAGKASFLFAASEMRELKVLFGDKASVLDEMATLLETRPNDMSNVERFFELAKSASLPVASPSVDDDLERGMVKLSASEILTRIPRLAPGSEGGATGTPNPLEAAWDKAKDFARVWTFWEMKKRAGIVGKEGLGNLLHALSKVPRPPRIHLIGHSFGARLVSFALGKLDAATPVVDSMTLIQGAFSHFAFADKLPQHDSGGALKGLQRSVRGALVATHSVHDTAVGTWYPIACSLSKDSTSAQVAQYGAMGADGAQAVDHEDAFVGPVPSAYAFKPGQFLNLDCSDVIAVGGGFSGAHSDIYHPEIAWVVACAAGLAVPIGPPAAQGDRGGAAVMSTYPGRPRGGGAADTGAGFRASIVSRAIVDASTKRPRAESWERSPTLPMLVELNAKYPGGIEKAHEALRTLLQMKFNHTVRARETGTAVYPYVPVTMTAELADRIARIDMGALPGPHSSGDGSGGDRSIHHIWLDNDINLHIDASMSTIKADAFHRTFQAYGLGVTWAVVDSGIQADHPHFAQYDNLNGTNADLHRDFTLELDPVGSSPADVRRMIRTALIDEEGHGTHVSGILAGGLPADNLLPGGRTIVPRVWGLIDQTGEAPKIELRDVNPALLHGVAPRAKLVSLKVIGTGPASNRTITVLRALRYLNEDVNKGGRELRVHGANLSLGYEFDPRWFACGRSPLCDEVDSLVRSGVVVVVSAGNTGSGTQSADERRTSTSLALTINDPGNARLAITVGSTHREKPFAYGVSYFSSKGPTGDGRQKPDLVAPGERIVSAAAGRLLESVRGASPSASGEEAHYIEESGTSMAAAHVSGACAALLSLRREFIGHPDEMTSLFTKAATSLGRVKEFQGAGLLDLFRAAQEI